MITHPAARKTPFMPKQYPPEFRRKRCSISSPPDAELPQVRSWARPARTIITGAHTLGHWRRVAVLQRDPNRFASIARRAAERLTREPSPVDEPLIQTRRRAGW